MTEYDVTPNLIDSCDIFSTPVQSFLKNHGICKDVAEQLKFLSNYNENVEVGANNDSV